MANTSEIRQPTEWRLWLPTLFDADETNRTHAARVLGSSGDPAAILPLLAAMESNLGMIAGGGTIARALVDLRQVWSVEAFVGTLEDPRGYVRRASAEALGWLQDDRAVEALIPALRDEMPGVRIEAAWALGVMGDLRAMMPLIEAMGDSDANVRRSVADALGEMGDPRTRGALETLLLDRDDGVRAAAEDAIRRLLPEAG